MKYKPKISKVNFFIKVKLKDFDIISESYTKLYTVIRNIKGNKTYISAKSLINKVLSLNPLSANPIKRSNTLKQFVGNLPTNCLSMFDHFVGLALKGLK